MNYSKLTVLKRAGILLVFVFLAAGCIKKTTPTEVVTPPPPAASQMQAISYQGVEGKTALELLKANYQVETKNFSPGPEGEFVKSIGGVTDDAEHFWSFYVNGQMAQVGAGSYITKAGDRIEWKLEKIN